MRPQFLDGPHRKRRSADALINLALAFAAGFLVAAIAFGG